MNILFRAAKSIPQFTRCARALSSLHNMTIFQSPKMYSSSHSMKSSAKRILSSCTNELQLSNVFDLTEFSQTQILDDEDTDDDDT